MSHALATAAVLLLLAVPASAAPITISYTVDPSKSWWSRCGYDSFFGYLGPCVDNPLPETPPPGFTFPPFAMSGAFSITTDAGAGTVTVTDLGIVVAGYPGFFSPFPLAAPGGWPPLDLSVFLGTPTTVGADLAPPSSCSFVGPTNQTLQIRYEGSVAIIEGRHECWIDPGPIQVRIHGVAIPEPGSLALIALGIAGLALQFQRPRRPTPRCT